MINLWEQKNTLTLWNLVS